MGDDPTQQVANGRTTLGIELGSTRIKACLVDEDLVPIAAGSHEWENEFVDGRWTYSLDAVETGLRAAYAALVADVEAQFGVRPTTFRAVGVSAMMHGYLAFDAAGDLLVPFRTWRNTSTGPAAEQLSEALAFNVPLRWSIAHLYQAVLDEEPHVGEVAGITTLAGYVHRRLTGRNVLGVGDASGVFPIEGGPVDSGPGDPGSRGWDEHMLATTQALLGEHVPDLRAVLPEVLVAGEEAGSLTPEGAAWLDPTGTLEPGAPLCPPEGDAGTGMVATNAVAPRTGNVSVGTSIFAMVVLEHPLSTPHEELDVVTTPAGDAVAMVHCNNGASEIASWAKVFGRFAEAAGQPLDVDTVYATLLTESIADSTDLDAGGLLSFNYLAGEPVTHVEDGRPLLLRTPDARFTLGNLVRSEVHGAFATLAIGMDVLHGERVQVDRMTAHGGLFRTPGAPQRLLAAALRVPIALEETAGEGGAWGIAVLAAYLEHTDQQLADFLSDTVFGGDAVHVAEPEPADVDGFQTYLGRYRAALPVQAVAAAATGPETTGTAAAAATGPETTGTGAAAAPGADATTTRGEGTAGAEPRLPAEQEVTR
ncbi:MULTISPECIES: xylulokinase [unclassified Curtobacterium]|uniref:xylulokinase n=1 Tax=unclassified Curtobacterium TaxID=257496 RepID=UPI000F4A9354|nr:MULTISPECIES: FGGY-family carbohydrate kinase [unclassified Curtobacterium]ROQ07251.1 sugar (pentulose or hexulose) kinase [Curtobacterium sp. PhB171]ROQ28177.1 sugar (pentulose or hexulose) kinase [Curtobacterium sp. PhB170]ROS35107.1 sugar (pentulose or hexulose) kinase [Curtobacterium sp. PhB131]ROS72526.1 sugar (pentulose or hexulose) kinase [Curtobacterium sp. PhB141]